MSKVSSFIDSLDFSVGRSKRKDFKFSEIKERREKVIEKFNENDKFYKEYIERDPPEIPGIIFCTDEVIAKYQNLTGFGSIISNFDKEERKKWLLSIPDKGELYYKVYNRLLKESEVKDLEGEQYSIILSIEKFLKDSLNESDLDKFSQIQRDLADYKETKVKTKKLKEKYAMTTRELDNIISKTNLSLDKYLNLITDFNICVQTIPMQTAEGIVFCEYIDRLNNNITSIKREKKFIQNTLTLKKESLCDIINEINQKSHPYSNQIGKYFKKWSLLLQEEKVERIESWIKYYIYKNFLLGKIISTNVQMEDLITKLSDLLLKEKISYRYIKWDVQRGIITKIIGVNYDNSNMSFTFKGTPSTEGKDDSSTHTHTHTHTTTTKKSIVSKIKTHEKIVNDTLLSGILLKKSLDMCIEEIKEKIGLKKLTSKERSLIESKYKDIELIVSQNGLAD
jgi:hypothetical protein